VFLFDSAENIHITTTLIGFGCMLAWINILRYIQYLPTYYSIYTTLKTAMPFVVNILIGIAPIYIGFALLGKIITRVKHILGVREIP
jgi:Polycystin cation channel